MNRRAFRTWGLELSPDDFARALAALGVLHQTEPTWPLPDDAGFLQDRLHEAHRGGEPLPWNGSFGLPGCFDQPTPARALAEAWTAFSAAWNELQLEIRGVDNGGSALWLLRQLGRPAVGAASVYLRADEPPGDASWQWPLRVGVLATDGAARAFRQALYAEAPDFLHRLTRPVELGTGPGEVEECDVLLLPHDLPRALSTVLAQARPPLADAVLVLGAAPGPDRRVAAQLRALRETIPGSGVARVELPEGLPTPAEAWRAWWIRVVEELSHDASLDRALFTASRAPFRDGPAPPPPTLFFARRLVEFRRISQRTRELADRLEEPDVADRELEVPEESILARHEGRAGRWSARELGEVLRNIEKDGWFGHETDGATATVEAEETLRRLPDLTWPLLASADVDRAGPTVSMPRWVEPERRRPRRVRDEPVVLRPDEDPQEERADKAGRGPTRDEPLGRRAQPEPKVEARGKRPTRYLQARVREATEAPVWEDLPVFLAGVDHEVRVRIGRRDEAWTAPAGGEIFPEDRLPEQETPHRLTVVFSEPALLPEPQVGTLTLPRRGDGSPSSFWLRVPSEAERVEGRVVVLHRNRVLQTARLLGMVKERDEEVGEPDRWRLEVEAEVRPRLETLDDRRPFDAAVVLNHTASGAPGVLQLRDDRAVVEVLPDFERLVRWFDDQLAEVAYRRDDFSGGLDAPATVDLLRSLARHGAELFEHLVWDQWGEGHAILDRSVERLQVISAHAGARLPLEMVYERAAPEEDAPLCPQAVEALEAGRCCGRYEDAPETCVCPLGFWATTKVLERHVHDPRLARKVGREGDFVVQPEGPERSALEVLGPSLAAASQRVEKTVAAEWKDLQAKLSDVLGAPTAPIERWEDWPGAISTKKPRLHLLLVHTDAAEPGSPLPRMEIGEGSWLALPDLDADYVRPLPDGAPPLVLLLGCETAAPEISFLGFPAKLRRHGAALVVCAQSTIHAAHAVPVAAVLIETLREEMDDRRATFGEIMRSARRKLLARGLPMVLCLLAFGDADWILVPSSD